MRLETIGVVTYNLWRDNKSQNVIEDVTYLMGRPEVDVVCLQEGANWHRTVENLVRQTRGTWAMADVATTARSSKQNIVLWRTRRFERKSARLIDLPEGRKGLSDRSVTRVRLELAGGRQLVVLATHMHSHVQNPAWWRLPRQLDYRTQLGLVVELAKAPRSSRAVLAVADWNADLLNRAVSKLPFFPTQKMRAARMRSNWEALGNKGISGTHGRRFIDAIFLRATPWLRFRDQQVIQLSSDHRALLVRFRVVRATPK